MSRYKEYLFGFLRFSQIVYIFVDSTKYAYGKTSRRCLKRPREKSTLFEHSVYYVAQCSFLSALFMLTNSVWTILVKLNNFFKLFNAGWLSKIKILLFPFFA